MHIHEYQGKDVLRKYGVPVPRGHACFSPDEAVDAATRLGGRAWMVKAQIHAGGRGKAGGVRLAWSPAEVRRHAADLLGSTLTTPQTGAEGRTVRRLLVEERIEIGQAFYVGMVVDREARRVALVAAPGEAGADAGTPQRTLRKLWIDPAAGVRAAEADGLARDVGFSGKQLPQVRTLLQNLYQAFDASDAVTAEIDPLVLTRDGRLMALDARLGFDRNGLFRQPEIAAMRDADEEEEERHQRRDNAESVNPGIARSGEIGCLVNGAGLAMATMDALRLHGGNSARVHDVGGGASAETVGDAVRRMACQPDLRAVLVNVFGGLVKCDAVARGLVAAWRDTALEVPLVVRLKGTNESLARTLLAQSGLAVIHADELDEAAGFAVASALSTPRRKACHVHPD